MAVPAVTGVRARRAGVCALIGWPLQATAVIKTAPVTASGNPELARRRTPIVFSARSQAINSSLRGTRESTFPAEQQHEQQRRRT